MRALLVFLLRCLSIAGLFMALVACESAAVSTPTPTTITITGSTAMRQVLGDLTRAYRAQHPNVLFGIRGGGSTLGEQAIRNGEVDIAASTLFPPQAESGTPMPPGEERLVRTPIGLNGLAIIVHASNPVDALSLVQLRDIFSGRVLDWQAMGSDAGEIQLVSREDGAGSRILFEERVMDEDRVSLTAVVMPTSADMVDYVAKNTQAIGYVSRSEVVGLLNPDPEDAARTQVAPELSPPPVKIVAVEGLLPTIEALRTQQYALTQPMYLITVGQPVGRVRQFIDFVLSPTGQAIVGRYHAPIREAPASG